MRVVIAPDGFGGMGTADQVAQWLAAGWARVAPDDDLRLAPMSDGGPGFAAVLTFANFDAVPSLVATTGPTGEPASGELVRIGSTVYVESALACGLDLLRACGGDVRTATTYGVGVLVAAAAALGKVDTVVVGLGGSGTNDGGAGMWAALGAEPADLLRGGGIALRDLTAVRRPPPPGVRLVAATDVDNPLLGFAGASAVYGPQKGADQAAVMSLDLGLERWADAVETEVDRPGLRDLPGAGAAGGLGFGLLTLGAERVSGIELVMDLVGLREKVEHADLVITGEGCYDATSLRGKVPFGVARVAAEAGVPCVIATGQSAVGAREAAAHGIDEVWSAAELLGSVEAAVAADVGGVEALGRAIAQSWSR